MRAGRIDNWIHGSFRPSATGLGAYRIFYAAFALLVVAPGHDAYASLAGFVGLPPSMFTPPPGPMQLFSGFPRRFTAESIHLLLNLSLAALLLGYRTRISSIVTGVLFLVLFGFSYSIGKINHNILFVLVPIVMSASGWGSALSLDALRRAVVAERNPETPEPSLEPGAVSWPLMLLGLIVGFAIFTAGFAKILGGWLDPTTHAAYGHVLKNVFVRGRGALLAPVIVGIESGVIWEIFDYLTVFFEVGFLAACAHRRSLRLFAGLAVLFHFGVMMTMNIAFAFNLAVYAAFVDWDRIAGALNRGRTTSPLASVQILGDGREGSPLRADLLGFLAVLSLGAAFYLVGSPLLWLDRIFVLDSDLSAREVLVVTTGAVLVLIFGLRRSTAAVRESVSAARAHLRRLIAP